MHLNDKLNDAEDIAFEPSELVEYGDVRHLTQGTGGPAATPDGATYNS